MGVCDFHEIIARMESIGGIIAETRETLPCVSEDRCVLALEERRAVIGPRVAGP